MPRPDKVQAVTDIKERIERANAVFLAEYAGLSVRQQQTLRRSLRESGAEFKVVKMTLARRATADLGIDVLDEVLIGPTGLAFAEGDPVGAARALRDFAKEHDVFTIRGGLFESEFLTPERVAELAEIEPRDVLLARIAGLFDAAMVGFAGVLNALPRDVVGLFDALIDKKREAGEPEGDAPEAAAEVVDEASETAAEPEDADEDDAADAASAKAEPAGEAASDDAVEDETDESDTGKEAAEQEPTESADESAEEE